MIICILLGLGMPMTAAYTVVALLVAPTLINQFFVPEVASHYFVFYAAILLLGLTVPIATCVAVATGIVGSEFWRTCYEAIKIPAPLFILPFAFVYHPELVAGELAVAPLLAGTIALFGAITIIHGINYRYMLGREMTYAFKWVFIIAGIVAMVHPNLMIQLAALAAAVGLYVVQMSLGKPDPLGAVRGVIAGINGRRRS